MIFAQVPQRAMTLNPSHRKRVETAFQTRKRSELGWYCPGQFIRSYVELPCHLWVVVVDAQASHRAASRRLVMLSKKNIVR